MSKAKSNYPTKRAEANLQNKSQRVKLRINYPTFMTIHRGLHLGYKPNPKGNGSWWISVFVGDKKTIKRKLKCYADDISASNGETILTFLEARNLCIDQQATIALNNPQVEVGKVQTVEQALYNLLQNKEFTEDNAPKQLERYYNFFTKNIIPQLGHRKIVELTKEELDKWHQEITDKSGLEDLPAREKKRKLGGRKETANRKLQVLKRALNLAYEDENNKIPSSRAWDCCKRHKNKNRGQPERLFYTYEEATKLLSVIENPDFYNLAQLCLYSGCRYGELSSLKVANFLTSGVLKVYAGKTDSVRHVPLEKAAAKFVQELIDGRDVNQPILFNHEKNELWRNGHQRSLMDRAIREADISPRGTFKTFRATYGSWLAMQGVPMKVISKLLGHTTIKTTEKYYADLADESLNKFVHEKNAITSGLTRNLH